MLPWTALELEFCKTCDYKPVIGRDPSQPHIEKARKEFRARFMCEDGKDSGVPGVLVATNVSKKWKLKGQGGGKFYLNANRDLFIVGVRSTAISRISGNVGCDCCDWVCDVRRRNGIGPDQEEPDHTVRSLLAWDANDRPRPRVLFEVEYKIRGRRSPKTRLCFPFGKPLPPCLRAHQDLPKTT